MAIHQTGKSSDLEKRLQLLRAQFYGKELIKSAAVKTSQNQLSTVSDFIFLKQDLIKISILSILAIGTQIVLFYLSKTHILNINLF